MGRPVFDPVNGADAAWLRLDSETNPLIITAMVVLEPLSFETLKQVIENRFLAFSRFSKRPVKYSGVYLWESDPEFQVDRHVRQTHLAAPQDQAALQTLVGELMSTPLPVDRPLWQFIHVPEYRDGNVLIMRVHHCYADGLSLAAVFGSISERAPHPPGNQSDAPVSKDKPQYVRQALHIGIDSVARAVEHCTRLSYRITEEGRIKIQQLTGRAEAATGTNTDSIRNGLTGAAELARLAALPSDNALALQAKLSRKKACAWSAPIPIASIKPIARQFGCSTNDLLLGAVAGGLRSYMAEHAENTQNLRLHATMPVNLRPLETKAGRQQLHELGNQFGTVFVPLPVAIANPIERLFKIKHDMAALKNSSQPMLSYTLMTAIGLMPGSVQDALLQLFSNKTSMVLSNVPGAGKARYLAGSKVKQLMFWVPQAGDIGLGISLLSYNGNFRIGINSDQGMVAKPEQLITRITMALQELLGAGSAFCQIDQRIK